MRDLDRRGPFRIGRAQPGRDCVVIPHAGRSLSHRGAKRKTLDPWQRLTGEFVVASLHG
jgi:hypothetical protein